MLFFFHLFSSLVSLVDSLNIIAFDVPNNGPNESNLEN